MRLLFYFLCFLTFAFLFLILIILDINKDKQKEKIKLWVFNQKLIAKFGQAKQVSNIQISTNTAVLGSKTQETQIPKSYYLNLLPRKQVFNLSCEFAAATAIIYYFTDNNFFASSNQQNGEKTLMEQIGVSQNPNIGIRMAPKEEDNLESLYFGLSQKFGGADYYGVHAPPFIELFEKYDLMARPIDKENVIDNLKKAIFSGHLVMTWIKIGYGESVDIALSYGTTKVVKGEHAIVINGYNEKEFSVMDPGSGSTRYISYDALLNSTKDFSMPFLEVYPSVFKTAYNPTEKVDYITGLDRSNIKIEVKNGSKVIGAGNSMGQILHDFGYKVVFIGKAENTEYEGVTINIKKEIKDYENLIKKDITLAGYKISSFSKDLSSDSKNDVLVVVGE